jgi:hypothetical protein
MTTENLDCSQTLRAIGQLLEALHIESFTLRSDGNDFLVRDRFPRRNREIHVRGGMGAVWKIISVRDAQLENSFYSTGVLQFRITQEDTVLLDREGQGQRRSPGKVPEIGAPSQILRAVGGFVGHKRGRILVVTKNDQDVYFEFELPSRETVMERFTVSSLYDFWVRMYLHRTDRHDANG